MVPYDAAKNIHDEFHFEFKNGKKNINILDYLQGFQKHINSYIQKARDSQALEAIHTKEKYQTSNETIQKKLEFSPTTKILYLKLQQFQNC